MRSENGGPEPVGTTGGHILRRVTDDLPLIALVVPDLASFAVDKGFRYAVPEHMADEVAVGSLVRIPLSGRRRRGHVVALDRADASGLKEIRAVSGDRPVFGQRLLEGLRWAAAHYVAPLSVVLAKAGPPNLPKRRAPVPVPSVPPATGPIPEVSDSAAGGRRHRSVHLLADGRDSEAIRGIVTPVVRADRSVLIIAPSVVEAESLGERLRRDLGARVIVVADGTDAVVTTAWMHAASQSGLVIVGTLRAIWWPVAGLAMAVVIDEGRRGMKDRQTPTVSARSVLRTRSQLERFTLVHVGRTPSTDTLAAGTEVVRTAGRAWPLVEVIDRTEEPPGRGVVGERVRMALQATVRDGRTAFVFTHRRGYSPAARCVRCRELRQCPACGARPDPGTSCARCGAELHGCAQCGGRRFEPLGAGVGRVIEEIRRVVASEQVGAGDDDAPIRVGTERDIVGQPSVDLAVAIDTDGLVRGTNYRAAEDALATLVRVAALVPTGRGRRMMAQTVDPAHPVLTALRRGDPVAFLESELEQRAAFGMPPRGEVVVIEVGDADEGFDAALRAAAEDATVFGPAPAGDRQRWLLQGPDLRSVKEGLRTVIARARDGGARIRVDADPRDL